MGAGGRSLSQVNISFRRFNLKLVVATIAIIIIIIVTVVFTGSEIVLRDPIVSLQVLDTNIFRVEDCIYLVKSHQFRTIVVD